MCTCRLLEIVPGPDFPTGGIICGRDGIIEGYRTGRGRLTLRAKIHVEEPRKGGKTLVVIDEMPYGVIRKSIVESSPTGEEGQHQGSVGDQRRIGPRARRRIVSI
jgi:DNA gyrase subunit A